MDPKISTYINEQYCMHNIRTYIRTYSVVSSYIVYATVIHNTEVYSHIHNFIRVYFDVKEGNEDKESLR